MKKISVIIPAYNVEEYIGTCIESLVNQTLKDIEIIIVNDGSKDNTGAVIESYREKYPDMIKAFHVENSGAAQARNFAIEAATGEYIGFVDSDDYVREDTYELLYNAAKEKDAQIVTSGYCRVGARSTKKMSFGNKNITAEEVFDKNIFEQPLLFDEVPYLWNKIFKADIIRENGLRFQKELRIYEDLVFTYQAFLFADKISRVDECLYNYIVSRDTSLTYRFSEKRFDLISASKILIDFYEKNNALTPEIKEALLYVILKHVYVILNRRTTNSEKKLKLKYCKLIFKFLNENFENWKDNFYFDKQNRNRLSYTSKAYWILCTLLGFKPNIKTRIRKFKKKITGKFKSAKRFVFGKRIGYKYSKYRIKPIEDKAVFLLSQQGKNLHGSMFYLIKELANNEQYADYTIYVGVTNDSIEKFRSLLASYNILDRVALVIEGGDPFIKALATAHYIFSDTSLPTYFVKRHQQIYLNTWHGTPLKTLGKATANDFFDIANVQKNFIMSNYLLYPSEYMRDIMLRDYMLVGLAKNKILMSGYPRNEIFFSQRSQLIREELGEGKKQFIAYMPTWRGNVRNVSSNEQIDITVNLLHEIDNSLKENQVFYVNMHPYVNDKIDFKEFKNIKKFPTQYETYEFLSCCDVLITDYSSVFFDFAVSKKKVVLFVYDEEEYLADRGMYLGLNELPFEKVYTVPQLMSAVEGDNISNEEYNKFIETYCRYDREDVSRAILEQIIQNKDSGLKIEDMPTTGKKNILVYAGAFKSSHLTEDFILKASKTVESDYEFYLSYVTKSIRRNKERFKEILPYIKYWGQLGSYMQNSKKDVFALRMLKSGKRYYPANAQRLKTVFENECKRNYPIFSFEGVLIYGNIHFQKIYELAHFPCKKAIYIPNVESFNMRVHPSIYEKFDKLIVVNEEIAKVINDYCGGKANVEIVDAVQSLNDFEKYYE